MDELPSKINSTLLAMMNPTLLVRAWSRAGASNGPPEVRDGVSHQVTLEATVKYAEDESSVEQVKAIGDTVDEDVEFTMPISYRNENNKGLTFIEYVPCLPSTTKMARMHRLAHWRRQF